MFISNVIFNPLSQRDRFAVARSDSLVLRNAKAVAQRCDLPQDGKSCWQAWECISCHRVQHWFLFTKVNKKWLKSVHYSQSEESMYVFVRKRMMNAFSISDPSAVECFLTDIRVILEQNFIEQLQKDIETKQLFLLALSCYPYFMQAPTSVPWQRHISSLLNG